MNQSSESVNHTISRLQTALPVVVIESIPEDLSKISTNILENGWAILVCGRRLFIWNYSQASNFINTCYELQLPPSDISHKADLVCLLFSNEKNQINSIPAVLAVSPEGTIRYWPKIANSNNNVELIVNDLQGQECNSLINLKPFGCLLSTTTNTLMHINIGGTSLNDSNLITCRLLKMPQGVFAGFRKFSSFIFGGTPNSQYVDSKSLVKVLQGKKHSTYSEVIVFAGNMMQKFEISYNTDKLIDEIDLDRLLKENILRLSLLGRASQIDQLNLWIIDAKYKSNDEVVIIFACIIKEISNSMNYILATLTTESTTPSHNTSLNASSKLIVKSMNLLRNYTSTIVNQNQTDYKFLNLHLVKETAYQQLHYIYDNNKVTCVQEGNDIVDTIFFGNSENEILGIGVWKQQPLIFTSKDSLITLTPSEELISLNSSTQFTSNDTDRNESDKCYWLKKAFNTYRKKDLKLSQQLIKDNFHGDLTMDCELDRNVILMGDELIDSAPNSDPRWPESGSQNINYNVVSILISNQLEEKYKNFLDLISFLKHFGIWNRLGTYSLDGKLVQTKLLLCEHGEKIVAADTLKRLEEEYNDQIDYVIRKIIERRNIKMNNNLTHHDYFYRQISLINQFFPTLLNYEEDCLNSNNLTSKEILEFIISCSVILITVFKEISYFRKNQQCFQEALNDAKNYPEFNLWTNTKGIRTTLIKQIDLLINYGIESKFKPGQMSCEDDIRIRTIFYQKLIDITDIVLEGYQYQMRIVKPESDRFKILKKDFENDRSKCIKPLIKIKQYERALSLAEKYEDFDTLISICEILNNNDRLNRYRIEFQEKGFSEHLFRWYMKEGKQSKMLINTSPFLGKFLENHENLYWLYSIQNNQFDKAGDCLLTLANNEDKILERKKTLYSLSKLSYLANGLREDDELIDEINKQHEVIAFQEIIHELMPNKLAKDKPLTPITLIEILIDEENDKLTEIEFKYALDLTTYIKDDIYKFEEIKKLIIVNAILRDKWNSYNEDDPLTYINSTLFYKLVKHAFLSGENISILIPSRDELLNWPEFDRLENKKSFIYLITILYESYIDKFMQ